MMTRLAILAACFGALSAMGCGFIGYECIARTSPGLCRGDAESGPDVTETGGDAASPEGNPPSTAITDPSGPGNGPGAVLQVGCAPLTVTSDTLLTCPEGYAPVAGGATTGIGPPTDDFCLAVFEMKAVDGEGEVNSSAAYLSPAEYRAESRADGRPWVRLSHAEARGACESLGDGYSLIDNDAWQTVALNLESVSYNWNTCTQGEGGLFTGLLGTSAPVSDVADPYTGTDGDPEAAYGEGSEQRRIFYLRDGTALWDMAGNVHEWTNVRTPTQAFIHVAVYADDSYPAHSMSSTAFYWDLDDPMFHEVLMRAEPSAADPLTYLPLRPEMLLPRSAVFDATSSAWLGPSRARGFGQFMAKDENINTKVLIRGVDSLFGVSSYAGVAESGGWNLVGFRCMYREPVTFVPPDK